jgi:hypothetical protein
MNGATMSICWKYADMNSSQRLSKQHFLQKLCFDVQYLAGLSKTKYAQAFALKNAVDPQNKDVK